MPDYVPFEDIHVYFQRVHCLLVFLEKINILNNFSVLNLKGYSGFKNPFSRLSLFGFNIMFDHLRVHIPNIGSLAHS